MITLFKGLTDSFKLIGLRIPQSMPEKRKGCPANGDA